MVGASSSSLEVEESSPSTTASASLSNPHTNRAPSRVSVYRAGGGPDAGGGADGDANAIATGGSLCPASVGGLYPSPGASAHTRAVKSLDPADTQAPSGDQARQVIVPAACPNVPTSVNGAGVLTGGGAAHTCTNRPTAIAMNAPSGEKAAAVAGAFSVSRPSSARARSEMMRARPPTSTASRVRPAGSTARVRS